MQVGRRIIFDRNTGNIVVDFGEMQGDVLPREDINELDYVDLPYGMYNEEFSRVKKYHVDTNTKEIVFDELYPKQLTQAEQIEELENQLLISQGVI